MIGTIQNIKRISIDKKQYFVAMQHVLQIRMKHIKCFFFGKLEVKF